MSRGGHRNSVWSLVPGLSDRLVELWNLGASATECAMRLGNNVSRSAALGRLMRLKDSGVEIRHIEPQAPQPKKPRPSRARPKLVIVSDPVVDPCTLEPLQLESGEFITAENAKHPICECRFPYGEGDSLKYCGRPTVGKSFCPAHAKITFQPPHAQPGSRL